MATNKHFPRKLTGATARLFAAACSHYSEAAEYACNDDPEQHPTFVRLSPQQRVHLVAQLATGLLCRNEPLPPDTLEHYAAYLGVVACLNTEIEIELDDIYAKEVGEDLLEEFYEKNPPDSNYRHRSKEEMDQRSMLEKVARKQKKKLAKKNNDQDETFTVPEREFNPEAFLESHDRYFRTLFLGGPCSEEQRRSPRPLTEDERIYGFRWRLLCDDAFQEHTSSDSFVPPMCRVNFCWKCYDPDIWQEAVLLLFGTHFGGDITPEEHAVQWDTINDITYADKTQHARIREVDRIVKKIRQSYDIEWDKSRLAEDQRLIYAVCDVERHWGRGHGPPFVDSFEDKCVETGFQLDTPNKYQVRLEIYRSIKGDFVEGLDKCIFSNGKGGYEACESPKDYKYDDDPCHLSCNNASCYFDRIKEGTLDSLPDGADLLICSRCLVVRYCSKECQRKDWKEHKKQCENLSIWRKDQDKIHELAQQF
jgi:hypothetical protein